VFYYYEPFEIWPDKRGVLIREVVSLVGVGQFSTGSILQFYLISGLIKNPKFNGA
jgi:hypothetical protein